MLRARLVIVDASDEVNVVPFARCSRLRMNICKSSAYDPDLDVESEVP